MASIYQRTNQDGTKVWRAVIRVKGHPSVSNHFARKQEAEDWVQETERQIRFGKYGLTKKEQEKTFGELVERYITDGVLEHHKAAKDTLRHLEYFRERLGTYALAYLTQELLLNERKKLLHTPTYRGKKRTAATVNRYMASLSGLLSYGHKNLGWIAANPAANLLKLKENPKQRRILTPDEERRLLEACRQSRSPYLYCITLIALTTGARKGEILAFTWDCIDFEARLALIKESKNGRSRRIALVDAVISELKILHEHRNPGKPLVFASKTAFGELDIKKSWESALKKADIKNFVFHGLRHHFASFGGQIGATGVQLRAQMGHTTSSMTDHYSHLSAEDTRFIGESIEQRLYSGVKNGSL